MIPLSHWTDHDLDAAKKCVQSMREAIANMDKILEENETSFTVRFLVQEARPLMAAQLKAHLVAIREYEKEHPETDCWFCGRLLEHDGKCRKCDYDSES